MAHASRQRRQMTRRQSKRDDIAAEIKSFEHEANASSLAGARTAIFARGVAPLSALPQTPLAGAHHRGGTRK